MKISEYELSWGETIIMILLKMQCFMALGDCGWNPKSIFLLPLICMDNQSLKYTA